MTEEERKTHRDALSEGVEVIWKNHLACLAWRHFGTLIEEKRLVDPDVNFAYVAIEKAAKETFVTNCWDLIDHMKAIYSPTKAVKWPSAGHPSEGGDTAGAHDPIA